MRKLSTLFGVVLALAPSLASAETVITGQRIPAKKTGSAALATATAAARPYTSSETPIGVLLDDPTARAVLVKHLPGVSTDSRIGGARGMTLRAIQSYAPQAITNEILVAIDADFAKLPASP
jgi:hypothetical protein